MQIAEVDYVAVPEGSYSPLVSEVISKCLTADPQLRPDSVQVYQWWVWHVWVGGMYGVWHVWGCGMCGGVACVGCGQTVYKYTSGECGVWSMPVEKRRWKGGGRERELGLLLWVVMGGWVCCCGS